MELARFFLAVRTALGFWRRNRRAALAAGKTYENARGAGAPHAVAAEAAFRILTKEERPELPHVVSETQPVRAGVVDSPARSGARPDWPEPQGSS